MKKQFQFCFISFFLFLFISINKLVGQPINDTKTVESSSFLQQMQEAFPNAKAVFTLKKKVLTIGLDNDSINITAENRFEMLHLRQKSEQFATESVPFSKFNQILSINAYTMINEDGKVKSIKAEDFVTGSVISKHWFYDDYKEKTFLFPSIEPGVTTVLDYKEAIKEPRFLGVFYLNSYVPISKSEYTLIVDKKIKIAYKIYGATGIKIDFKQKKEGNNIIYSWKATNLAEYKTEKNSPNISYYEPHIVVYITHINKKPLLADPSGLYDWYYSMVKNVNKEVLPEIKSLVDTLTKDSKTDREKAKVLFHWVQSNVKYIAIEDGLSGFIPRSANEVYKNRYGDCKDMTSMLVTMFNIANIPTYLSWIGTRKLPYTYKDVPTPMVDNHMIATAKIDGENVFLDATDSYVPFGMPTAMIQGKEVMIGIDSANYQIMPVPIVASEQNSMIDTCWIEISQDDIIGKGSVIMRGYYKANAGFGMIDQQPEEQKYYVSELLALQDLSPEMQQVSCEQKVDNDQQLTIKYDFVITKHCKISEKELFLNLNLDKRLKEESIQINERKTDKEIEYQFNDFRCYIVEIPKNYTIGFIPPNSNFQTEHFGFIIEYEVKGNQILMRKKVYCNYLFLKKKDFASWNKMIQALNFAYRNNIKLIKTN